MGWHAQLEHSMKVEEIGIRHLQMPLKSPFETSWGKISSRDCLLLTATSGGCKGYAQSVAFAEPFYTEETTATVWHMLEDFLIPRIWHRDVANPSMVSEWFAGVRRNFMAKATLEGAIWDLACKVQGIALAKALGGNRPEIEVGISIGLHQDFQQTLDQVEAALDQGYKKIKVKIKPGHDLQVLHGIRNRFGRDVPLMADANSSYSLQDLPTFREMDRLALMMIEQPLAHDDLLDHARLQRELQTPVCLDESICSVEDARHAIELGSCRIVSLKIGRVGGLTAAKSIHDLCQSHQIPVWCGGMIETGVGRAHNMAIASLPNFTIPGDTSPSHRSFAEDILEPSIDFSRPGRMLVPASPGIGFNLREDVVEQFTVAQKTYRPG